MEDFTDPFDNEGQNSPEGISPEKQAEILGEIVENIDSINHDGMVYLHVGHVMEVLMDAVDILRTVPGQIMEATGEDTLNAQTVGYLLGVYEIARTLNYIVRALQIKHADDVAVPMDEFLAEVSDFLKEEGEK